MSEQATDRPKEQAEDTTIVSATPIHGPKGSPHRASLIVLDGWEIGHEFEIHGENQIVGRSGLHATTVVNAASVSRQHARFDRVSESGSDHFTLTDLNSSNGTYVNNVQVSMTRLGDGDKVRMGDVLFKFVLQDDADAEFHRQVHRRIHFDQLTGLMTMDSFRDRLESFMRNANPETVGTLAMTDLDGLKRVNDTHGHLAGRMVVAKMGQMIRTHLRTNDLAGLYGGDEGIVLYPHTRLAEAASVAEAIREAVEKRPFEHSGATFHVSISQGLAEWPRHGQSVEALIAVADRALYDAKAAGRNRVVCAGDAEPEVRFTAQRQA